LKLKEIFLISVPIGNAGDLPPRALSVLQQAEALVIEELPSAKKFLDLLGISMESKTIYQLNEHNQKQSSRELAETLWTEHTSAAIFSEAGSPLLADPGENLIAELITLGVEIRYVPGASSIVGGLLVSGFPLDHFFYAGFLPRKDDERLKKLKELKNEKSTIVILETPYRLVPLLESAEKIFSSRLPICLAFDLTTAHEEVLRGELGEIKKKCLAQPKKSPFVLILNNRKFLG
jgi:16S rRNA (cytidine1402-2'-O)-methyltransferase